MEKSQQGSLPSDASRFDGGKLAQRIAQINGGEVRTVQVEMVGKEDVKEWIDGLNELRNKPPRSDGPRCKMQIDTKEVEPSPGRKLAEAVAAVHGAVPVVIKGKPFDPAVAELLRKLQKARAVPPSNTSRCKN